MRRTFRYQEKDDPVPAIILNPQERFAPCFGGMLIGRLNEEIVRAGRQVSDLREVNISLSWTNNNVKRTRTTRTYVSHYGIQNYVLQ